MSDYDKLMRIVDKEVININELRQIVNDDLVAQMSKTNPDPRRKNYFRYEIKLTNGEIYFVFVKKPWNMILFGDKNEE